MKSVRLGKTGLAVSRVAIGGIPLTRPSEAEAIRVVQRALDLGVNLIDTARGYGLSEARIGKAIAGRRDEVFIATKGWGDKSTAAHCIEESLRQLSVDTIDLWQFHGINTMERYEEIVGPGGAMEAALEARQAGKIRHIGFSSHALSVALRAVASDRFETVQFPFSFIAEEPADELISLAQAHDVGFIAMKPFAGGRIRSANLAIRYLLQFDSVVPDPGVESVAQVEEIVGIAEEGVRPLTPAERQEMAEIRERVGTRFCRQCEYCMPCPQGVFICGVMYLPVLHEVWPEDWYFSWDYVRRSVESAERCVECGECEPKCPYQLPIREIMAENLAFHRRAAAEYEARRTAG